MQQVLDNAEYTLRNALKQLPSGQFSAQMDDGTQFKVALNVDAERGSALVDFTGTYYRPDQPQHPGNFNAPSSVVMAAVLYSFRVLVARPMPLNAGFFRPLTGPYSAGLQSLRRNTRRRWCRAMWKPRNIWSMS